MQHDDIQIELDSQNDQEPHSARDEHETEMLTVEVATSLRAGAASLFPCFRNGGY